MAEERNVHHKLAMAEGYGCFLIGWVALIVAAFCFEVKDMQLAALVQVSTWVGWGLVIAAVISFINENILCTMVFGPLAFFFIAFPNMVLVDPIGCAWAAWFIAIILLVDAIIALYQPVRLLPILLLVAFILFVLLGAWFNEQLPSDSVKQLAGVFATLLFLLATYIGWAVGLLVVKGKPVLPLLLKK